VNKPKKKKPNRNNPYCHLAGRLLTIPVTTRRNIPWVELLFLTLRNSRLQFAVCFGLSLLGRSSWCYIYVCMCVYEHKFVQVTTNSHIWNSFLLLKRSSIHSSSYPPQVDFSKISYLKQDFRTLISWKDDCNINKTQSSPAYCEFLTLYVIEEQKWFVID